MLPWSSCQSRFMWHFATLRAGDTCLWTPWSLSYDTDFTQAGGLAASPPPFLNDFKHFLWSHTCCNPLTMEKKHLSLVEKARIVTHHEEGVSLVEIGWHLQISKNAVSIWVKCAKDGNWEATLKEKGPWKWVAVPWHNKQAGRVSPEA